MTPETEPPRQAEPPVKLKRFVESPLNRDRLKQILRDPVFIAAMNLLESQSRVTEAMIHAMPDVIVARKAAYQAGVSGVYERLEALTHTAEVAEMLEGWDHLTPTPDTP